MQNSQILEHYRAYVDQCISQTPIDGTAKDIVRPVSFDEWHQTIFSPNKESYSTPEKPRYGWGWRDSETTTDKWIEIGTLRYENDEVFIEEEYCVVMLRDAKTMEEKYPGITAKCEIRAQKIVDGLNRFYSPHIIAIDVEGGCVTDVSGLPEGWNYEIIDFDEPGEGYEEEEEDYEEESGYYTHEAHGTDPLTEAVNSGAVTREDKAK